MAAGLSCRGGLLSFCVASSPLRASADEGRQEAECGWWRHSWVRAAVWLTAIAMQDPRGHGILPHESSNAAHRQRAGRGCLAAWSKTAGALTVHWAGWKARPTNCGPLLLPGPPPSSTPTPAEMRAVSYDSGPRLGAFPDELLTVDALAERHRRAWYPVAERGCRFAGGCGWKMQPSARLSHQQRCSKGRVVVLGSPSVRWLRYKDDGKPSWPLNKRRFAVRRPAVDCAAGSEDDRSGRRRKQRQQRGGSRNIRSTRIKGIEVASNWGQV